MLFVTGFAAMQVNSYLHRGIFCELGWFGGRPWRAAQARQRNRQVITSSVPEQVRATSSIKEEEGI
tara:strand:- start:328 stop:525 length:198 start_codon:yes stop_codon:yes gene_type:complete